MSWKLLAGPRRCWTIFSGDLAYQLRRPLFIVWALMLVLVALGFSGGKVRISSGDATVGGTKSFITSEFALGFQLSVLTILCYGFFVAVAAGMSIIQDEEWRLGELLHATPLRPGEYVWGKLASVLVASAFALGIHLAAMAFFFHVLPNAEAQEYRGAFATANYLKPALIFSVPTIVFFAGIAFAAGEWTRRPVAVYLLPVLIVLVEMFFLMDWSPSWLDPRLNRVLMLIDPSGFRWLNETWLKVDRGVHFYNEQPIPLDAGFVASRLALAALGLGAVAVSTWHFAAHLRGTKPGRRAARRWAATGPDSASASVDVRPAATVPLATLGMTIRPPGRLAGIWHVARVELAELRSSPGLYLFSPLLLLMTMSIALVESGFLDTSFLITPTRYAVNTMGTLATCSCLLLMFYTVESLERERTTRLAAILQAAPIRSGSVLLGKVTALAVVAAAIVLTVGLGGVIAILVQQQVRVSVGPFLIYWGLLLVPTIALWIAFVMAAHAITQSRYMTYALAIGVLELTGYLLNTDRINWVGNWPLWGAVRASDMSVLELDRAALVLSRLMAIGLAIFFGLVAARWYRRREPDATRIIHRLRPRALAGTALRLAPWALLPVVAGTWLAVDVGRGREGGAAKKQEKDYWRKNLATFRDARSPGLRRVELHLDLFPERSGYHARGTYELVNDLEKPLRQVWLTGGPHWEKLAWTRDGEPYQPEDRARLYVFTPAGGVLAPGRSMTIGFEHEGTFPPGISRKSASAEEFILPSAVVLTSFRPTVAPMLGFFDDIGVDEENRQDAKEYPDDFYEGQTDSFTGAARSPFATRITITGPADFTLNSVGTRVEDSVKDGRRTAVWVSEHPVSFFNVVAGRWAVERGEGTAVFYQPGHPYNIPEMRRALDGARRYYSDWFFAFPWGELKLSEFPNLASYAQGFPTDITFSEGIGFLTESTPQIHAAFEITAHEAAHQWWGNILVPGKGPGGVLLAEGTSHFSAILLVEQVYGLNARIDFCKRLEASYATDRQADSERPLVKLESDRPGDVTAIYDKGGWVFWMLLDHMGRDRALEGMRAFFKEYHGNPDHPVLQDFLAVMRRFAADREAFDAFARQWFHQVVVPEYRITSPTKALKGSSWELTARVENAGTGRMPVEVAAARGERFAKDGSPDPQYREVRTTITLDRGEARDVLIACPFEPDRVIVDPDAKVLQLRRNSAPAKL
jgi:ABC-2 type transport system permease protein